MNEGLGELKCRRHFVPGEMSVDDTGQNYDDEDVDAAIDRIKPPVDTVQCVFF